MPTQPPVEITRDDRLLRRVLHRDDFIEWHPDFGRWVPRLAAIRFDADGMSAFIRHLLEAKGDGPEDVRTLGGTDDKAAVVYEFVAQAARDAGYGVEHSPNEQSPIGYAHASIIKPEFTREAERTARTILASNMSLVDGTVDLRKPPGA